MATPKNGQENFPVTDNEAYGLVETIAKQRIKALKSTNRIIDGLYYEDVEDGTVIEDAIMLRAEKQVFNNNKCFCDDTPIDPKLAVRYFQNWQPAQWETAIRDRDIRAIIAKNGNTTVESVAGEIMDTLTQGEGRDDFEQERGLILSTTAVNYATIAGGTPSNMRGVLYILRDMYNQIKYDMAGYTIVDQSSATNESDIRIAISDKLLALLDVTELANIFNLEKAEIFGKLVIIPVADLPKSDWYKVVVYDRMRFQRYTRLFVYDQSPKQPGQFVKAYLTTDRMYLESELYKAAQIDCTAAATAQFNAIMTATPAASEAPAKA